SFLPSVSISAMASSAQAILARRRMVSTLMPWAAQAAVSMLRGLKPNFCTTRSSLPAASSSLPTRSDSTTRAELPGRAARISFCVSTRRTSRGKSHAGAHPLAVAIEIGLVVGEEIGVGGGALGRRVRVEHNADDAQEPVVFDHQNAISRHGEKLRKIQGADGSRSS